MEDLRKMHTNITTMIKLQIKKCNRLTALKIVNYFLDEEQIKTKLKMNSSSPVPTKMAVDPNKFTEIKIPKFESPPYQYITFQWLQQ